MIGIDTESIVGQTKFQKNGIGMGPNTTNANTKGNNNKNAADMAAVIQIAASSTNKVYVFDGLTASKS